MSERWIGIQREILEILNCFAQPGTKETEKAKREELWIVYIIRLSKDKHEVVLFLFFFYSDCDIQFHVCSLKTEKKKS